MKEYGVDSKQSWLVVLASSAIKFMTYGPTEVAGMLMVYTMHRFSTTRESASLPYTLVYTIRNGSGPIIAYMGNVIGLRTATLIGCMLSSIAMAACFFAENVMTVTILWGIIFGFGFALQGLLLNSITMEHFEKNLSKAVGFSNAGAIFGVCCFSPYLDFLVNSYGLSGAFLLLAGATLHAIPAALYIILNKPLNQKQCYTKQCEDSKEDSKLFIINKRNNDIVDSSSIKNPNKFSFANQKTIYILSNYSNQLKSYDVAEQQITAMTYKAYGPDEFKINWIELDQQTMANYENGQHKYSEPIHIPQNSTNNQKCDKHMDILYSCEKDKQICNFPIHGNKTCDVYTISASEKTANDGNINSLSESNTKNSLPARKASVNANKLMKILFTHPIFWLMLICNGLLYFILPAFYTLQIDYAIDIGIDASYSKYIVMYSTCTEFVGSLVLGWVADLKLVSSNGFVIILFLCQSVALFIMPWAQNVIFLAIVILAFQWTATGILLSYPSVVSDSLAKDIQPSALASIYLLAAPLDLAISPLIGYFRDYKGSYSGVYFTLALAAFIGGLTQMIVLRCVNRNKNKI